MEYVTDWGGDTLYYASGGDDHPSPVGNRTATDELVPLLNVAYHRWQSGAPAAARPTEATAQIEETDERSIGCPVPLAMGLVAAWRRKSGSCVAKSV